MVPGVGLITAMSILAANLNIPASFILVCAILGAFIGDLISYLFGRLCQPYLPNLWPFKQHPNWISDGEHFFQRHGGKSIFIGRFIGPIRPFIPMVAGMMKMKFQYFLLLNGFSAVLWGILYLLPSYYLGEQFDIHTLFTWQGFVILTAISIIAVLVSLRLKRRPH